MFDSTKEDLVDLLKQIDSCRLQLPDFQRDWVWDDDGIRALLASIVRSFPVGAVLTLVAGGTVKFKPRPLSGVRVLDIVPDEFLLDGQQRLTSLYQAVYSAKPVQTKTAKGQKIERYYYVDIKEAVSAVPDYDKLIIGVPADRVLRGVFGREVIHDLSEPAKEYAAHMFPLNKVFYEKDWIYGWREYWRDQEQDIYDLEKGFDQRILDSIQRYKMPVIRLDRDNSREAVCLVFEKVNTGGKKLDAFELLTAIYAADEFNLRDDWFGVSKDKLGRRTRITEGGRLDVFSKLSSTDFLQACTVLHSYDQRQQAIQTGKEGRDLPPVSCKREALLALPVNAYKTHSDNVEKAFREVGKFLNGQKIIWQGDVPYPTQSVALAAAFALLGKGALNAAAQEKFVRWFWCGVLGELYGSSTETRIANDVPQLVKWIAEDGSPPETVSDALFQIDRLDSLRIRISAAYKGMHALLMRSGCRDFITGNEADIMTFFQDEIDIHHIFPRKWCEDRNIDPQIYNSIVNKTALSAASNRSIGGSAPSEYLARVQEEHGLTAAQLDEILRTHLIEPESLRADDFEAFYEMRKRALAKLIGDTMKKPVVVEDSVSEPMGPIDEEGAADEQQEDGKAA